MTAKSPLDRLCDCPCSGHHGRHRRAYNAEDCACLLTCATQPLTLWVPEWGCALFNHPDDGHLWFVRSEARETWDWTSANEVDPRADVFEAGRAIETSLRRIEAVVAESRS